MSSSAKKKAKLEHNQDNFLNRREKRRIFGPRDKRFQNRNGDARPPLPDEELVKRQLQLSRERRHKREYEIILGIIANRKLNFKIKKLIWNEIYINTPFKEEMLSDVCIEIIAPHFEVNKIMNLHKNVLSQSPYFKALFNSSWIESNQEVVKITINDGNITEKSVDILFDSFYTSKLTCDQDDEDLISLIATARMFAADEVATLCAKELFKTITVNNAIYSYYTFTSYGFNTEGDKSFVIILRNFAYWHDQHTESFMENVMKIMDQQFFQKLVSHEDFIVKDDFTLYKLIKKWALVNFKHKVISNYCRKWSRKDKNPFLMTEHGRPYVKLFKVLRLNNIILNNKDFESLKKDNIIPLDWIKDAVVAFSSQMKAICSGTDATFLTSFPKDAFRVGIFHSDEAQTFTEKFINYYGIHLRLNWSDGVFSLYRHKRESIYDHGTCSLQLRLTLYTPETAVEREAYENILVIKQLIKEDETIILFKKEHSNVTGNIEAPVDPSRMFLHERELFFPTTIGIDLLYLSGAQDKQLNDK